ncbi:MAG TPA: hypothetical protein VIZ31_06040 [Vicinamibacteria bacterium]
MAWPSAEELEDLVARFKAATLPKVEWTHAAHQAVGAWHVHHLGAADALGALRAGIRRLNDSHGTANTPTSGYHESITRAYTVLLEGFLDLAPGGSLAENVQRLLASPLASREILLRFYTKETLMSALARAQWVEPDRRPLEWPLPDEAEAGATPA